ncbi:hypothetical protein [Winogradskyella arenosi]|uniref:Uncharacterized protein n=1 Tax=Winogradskyella arenosi TaxID=533325 RepID=A0A368ZDZ6_9FLAO|nr:hypothetical protein [Winogradskyella arenosi]RCW91477.1 hypothetical protein DFQ08_103307 [Winogradskyella arenosi]
MAFSIAQLFGNKTSKSQDSIEAIINDVENNPFGVAETNVLFAGLNELGGYYFFQTVIVGDLNVKCKKGAQLTFIGDGFKLKLEADMPEFESESSDVKGRYVTKIDFQMEQSDVEKLEIATLQKIQLKVKEQDLSFAKYVVLEDSEAHNKEEE